MRIPLDDQPSLLEEVLFPEELPAIVPAREAPASALRACVRELGVLIDETVPIDPAWRPAMAGDLRTNQATLTEIALRMLQRSRRLQERSRLTPRQVQDLLGVTTVLGAAKQAAWPLALYGLIRCRARAARIGEIWQEIVRIGRQRPDLALALDLEDRPAPRRSRRSGGEESGPAAGEDGPDQSSTHGGKVRGQKGAPRARRAARRGPAGEQQAPTPALLVAVTQKLMGLAERLGVIGQGGEPPLELSKLPGPEQVFDPALSSRTAQALALQSIFPEALAPVAPQLDLLDELYQDYLAAFTLYAHGHTLLRRLRDLWLATGPGHRLVLRQVLPAVADVLRQPDLPAAERMALARDLAELNTIIQQALQAARSARKATEKDKKETQAMLALLAAESQLVEVMTRMASKEPVSDAELAEAARTYERFTAGPADDG